jgi:hypothetical protein
MFAVCLALWGCTSLKAVRVTAEAGEQLAVYEPELRYSERTCRLLIAARLGSKCPTSAPRWTQALAMLTSYSRQLGKVAKAEPPSVGDDVQKALDAAGTAHWLSLTEDTDKNIAKVASGVTAFLTQEANRAAAQHAIHEVGPALDEVVKLLVIHLRIEREQLARAGCLLACAAGRPGSAELCPETVPSLCTSPEAGTAFLFTQALFELEDQDRRLFDAQKAFRAFQAAHARLYNNVDAIDSDAVYRSIVEDVSVALKAGG